MATITINGRKRHFSRITSMRRVKNAYHVETYHGAYTIDGGRKCGGSSRDWFVSGEHIKQYITCTSVMDELRLLDTM